jgi:integrase/recombinase XerD
MQRRIHIKDGLDLFLLDCQARRLTKSTQTFYRTKIQTFINELGAETLQEITGIHVRAALVALADRGLSSQSQNNIARAIRAFFNFCVSEGLLSSTPMANVKLPRVERKVIQSLTQDEVNAILLTCENDRDKALVLFILDTGVRASELVSINVEDMDQQTGATVVRKGKGQKQRTIHCSLRTRRTVLRYLIDRGTPSGKEPLFAAIKPEGQRLTLSGIVQLFERLRKASGVDGCQAHNLRRTFAIECLRGGMNIFVLARLMGHSDISVLRPYLALVEHDLQAAHAKASPVDRLT